MKSKELRHLPVADLEAKETELRSELVKIRNEISRGTSLKRPDKARTIKRNIARILTIISEKSRKGSETKTQEAKKDKSSDVKTEKEIGEKESKNKKERVKNNE